MEPEPEPQPQPQPQPPQEHLEELQVELADQSLEAYQDLMESTHNHPSVRQVEDALANLGTEDDARRLAKSAVHIQSRYRGHAARSDISAQLKQQAIDRVRSEGKRQPEHDEQFGAQLAACRGTAATRNSAHKADFAEAAHGRPRRLVVDKAGAADAAQSRPKLRARASTIHSPPSSRQLNRARSHTSGVKLQPSHRFAPGPGAARQNLSADTAASAAPLPGPLLRRQATAPAAGSGRELNNTLAVARAPLTAEHAALPAGEAAGHGAEELGLAHEKLEAERTELAAQLQALQAQSQREVTAWGDAHAAEQGRIAALEEQLEGLRRERTALSEEREAMAQERKKLQRMQNRAAKARGTGGDLSAEQLGRLEHQWSAQFERLERLLRGREMMKKTRRRALRVAKANRKQHRPAESEPAHEAENPRRQRRHRRRRRRRTAGKGEAAGGGGWRTVGATPPSMLFSADSLGLDEEDATAADGAGAPLSECPAAFAARCSRRSHAVEVRLAYLSQASF